MLAGMVCVTSALLLLGLNFKDLRIGSWQVDPILPLLGIMSLSGLGMGMLIPSSNNANLDMLPQRAAVLSGIRGLFHNTGGVIGTALIVLWLALNEDKALGLRWTFTTLGSIMLAAMPLCFLIPDGAAERRRGEARAARERAEAELAAARSARSREGVALSSSLPPSGESDQTARLFPPDAEICRSRGVP
jgi:MFS family permease